MSSLHVVADSLRYSANVARTGWSLRWLGGHAQHHFLKEMSEIWGDRFRFPLGLRICTVMSHPEAVRQIFENHAGSLSITTSRRKVGGLLPSKCLFYRTGENAQIARKVVAASFADTIAAFDDQPFIDELVSRLRSGSDIAPAVEDFSSRLAIQFIVGDADSVLLERLARTMRSWTGISVTALGIPFLRKLPQHRVKFEMFSQALSKLLSAVYSAQTGRRFSPQSMMSQLENRAVEHGISVEECCHNLAMFAGAIAHNLRIVIANSLKHLAGNECWQGKLRLALQSTSPIELESSAPCGEAAKISKAIIQESLRINPPVPLISRYVQTDTRIDGVRLKRGQLLFVSPWLSHYRAESFEDPTVFNPERFLGSQRYENCFIPFGGGGRHCLGAGFTYGTIGRVLGELVKHFQMHAVANVPVARSHRMAGFNLVPAEIPICLTSIQHRVETEVVHA